MALVPDVSEDALLELDAGKSVESLTPLINSQKELFHSQIEQLQKIVVAQCRLTGVNPLSQEMAAGALSIKIGKKPRDLLNPKAVNYMQSIFSVKDTIGKKETREISALCGVTVTQVRDFFAGQRSRVRKLVRLSRDKATRLEASRASSDRCSFSSEQSLPAIKEPPMGSADTMIIREQIPVPGNAMIISSVRDNQQITTDLKKVEEAPSYSALEETAPGIDTNDKKFLDSIFNLMRKEETFSGQVKLMEWVLQIHNSAVLIWFLTQGGLTILATWLSQAALEEQTTVIPVIFKVLCHLPLHKSFPEEMSAILQTVNRLRFYRTSDISNRARTLLSRWTKLFIRSQALKKPLVNSSKDLQKEIIRKQSYRISDILSDQSWQSNIDIPEDILALTEDTENNRKSESKQALKVLAASSDESSRKHGRSVSLSKTRERRKVLLVEQPDCNTSGRGVQLSRTAPSNYSRPISADDIQKAKMRAMFMQNKYGRADTSNGENKPQKTKDDHMSSLSQTSKMLSASRIPQLPLLKKDEETKPSISMTNTLPSKQETLAIPKPNTISQEQLLEKLKSSQIQWQPPPEIIIDSTWRVSVGGNSKEVVVQTQRNQRERETFYSKPQDIPLNPKEPWDLEMDFDDSLTPEIPIEPSPDADTSGDASSFPCSGGASKDLTPATPSAPSNNGNPEPDLELLAVLLKNPKLVFALTSGQGKALASEETVALLDMLKKSGVGLTELMNGVAEGLKEKPLKPEPTSLPSPTPPSDSAARASWKSDFPARGNAPVLQPHFPGSRVSPVPLLTATPQTPTHVAVPPVVVQAQAPGLPVTINPTSKHNQAGNFLSKRPSAPLAHQIPTSIYPSQTNVPIPSPSVPGQQFLSHNPSPMATNLHALLPMPSRQQPSPLAESPKFSPKIPTWPPSAASANRDERPNPIPDRWLGRSNGLLETRVTNQQFFGNQNNYNAYPKGSMSQPAVLPGPGPDRNEILDRSELETWSPEGSPMRLSELRGGQKFMEAKRDHGRSHRSEWSRHWDSENWDRYRAGGTRRRRDRDGDRRR